MPEGKKKRLYKHCGRTIKGKTIYLLGIPEEDRKEEKKIFEAIMTISPNECQTPQLRSSENTDQERCKKKQNKTTHLVISYSNFKKQKLKNLEETPPQKSGRHLIYRGAKIRMTSDFFSENIQARREGNEIFKLVEKMREKRRKERMAPIKNSVPCKISLQK